MTSNCDIWEIDLDTNELSNHSAILALFMKSYVYTECQMKNVSTNTIL